MNYSRVKAGQIRTGDKIVNWDPFTGDQYVLTVTQIKTYDGSSYRELYVSRADGTPEGRLGVTLKRGEETEMMRCE